MSNYNNGKTRITSISNTEELTERQLQAAELLQNGEHTKSEIAEIVGVHRNTITAWCKDDRFKAALHELANEKNRQTLALLKAHSTRATEVLLELLNSNDKRVQMEAAKYILDRNLGKTTAKVEVEDTRSTDDDYDIQAALERIKETTTQLSSVDEQG